MKIEVVGGGCISGCMQCKVITVAVKRAAQDLHLDVDVATLEDPREIAERGVSDRPALILNGSVVPISEDITVNSVRDLLARELGDSIGQSNRK